MADADWFEVCSGPQLMQGDVLFGCSVVKPHGASTSDQADEIDVSIDIVDVVVVTQSCDLEHSGKIENILLAKLDSYDDIVSESLRQRRADHIGKAGVKFREKCVRNQFPNFMLLRHFTGPPSLAWSLVDFRSLYILPKSVVEAHASNAGDRLRLLSPYREHLSQSFARYFMRVGLPSGASEFENYKSPAVA
ncbi:hypothetical protein [Micromonospora sp. WMMD710]|uniref:hypothetical protein n=1 Tax=Micromonospora sp. WMMD710 TaxID=3016085 RepID=UPI002415B982|nr:hypothetical protein [Micromonospora sp. WMMD710]MDG4756405.1 hypothetical protein [Micromonospora sp. WMMD710]